MSFSFVSVYYKRKAIGKRDYLNHIIQLKQSKINTKMKKLSFSLNNRTDRKFFQEKWKDLFSKGTLLIFRTCPHRVNVRFFRNIFVGGKAIFDEKTCMNPYVERFLINGAAKKG